jgi:hypothetical protein
MRDLLVLLNQVQPFRDDRVVLELVPPDLEQDLDHILNPLVDRPLVKYGSESLKDSVIGLGRIFSKEGSDLSHKADGDLDAIVGRLLEHENEHLKGDDLMGDGLIDEVSDERGGGLAYDLSENRARSQISTLRKIIRRYLD